MLQASKYVTFKDDGPNGQAGHGRLKAEWESGSLKPSIVVVILFAAYKHWLMTGQPAVITSLYRPKTTDSGVHEAWQAGDLRTTHLSAAQKREWLDAINAAFPDYGKYSSKKAAKTAKIHNLRGEDGDPSHDGEHLHLQSPPREPQPT
jgi:hypothetical protein